MVQDDLGDDMDVACKIVRRTGSTGTIRGYWHTEEGSALANNDFVPGSGTVQFEHRETSNTIMMKIKSRARLDGPCEFKVILKNSNPQNTAMDVESESNEGLLTTCSISIHQTRESEQQLAKLHENLKEKFEEDDAGNSQGWTQQFFSAIYVNGSKEAQIDASASEWVLHILCVPWKLFFSLTPPPKYFYGWPCFCIALLFIALITILINDLAYLIGCLLTLNDTTTAITIVALGTSLPDTFASRSAAIQDEYADASIGNVTGSNSVNVFLGLGISWTWGAIYWHIQGSTDKWKEQCCAEQPQLLDEYPDGAFVVSSKGIVLNTVVYLAFSIIAILSLYYRRHYCGGELGGDQVSRRLFAAIFFLLWASYVVIVSVGSYYQT